MARSRHRPRSHQCGRGWFVVRSSNASENECQSSYQQDAEAHHCKTDRVKSGGSEHREHSKIVGTLNAELIPNSCAFPDPPQASFNIWLIMRPFKVWPSTKAKGSTTRLIPSEQVRVVWRCSKQCATEASRAPTKASSPGLLVSQSARWVRGLGRLRPGHVTELCDCCAGSSRITVTQNQAPWRSSPLAGPALVATLWVVVR